MFNIGMGELLLLLVLAFVVIGPKDFPKVSKGLIKALRYLKKLAGDAIGSLNAELGEEAEDIKEIRDIVEDTVKTLHPDNLLSGDKGIKGD